MLEVLYYIPSFLFQVIHIVHNMGNGNLGTKKKSYYQVVNKNIYIMPDFLINHQLPLVAQDIILLINGFNRF